MCRVAPADRHDQTSHADASNATPAIHEQASAAVSSYLRWVQRTSEHSEACSTATPLGRPVEPDV